MAVDPGLTAALGALAGAVMVAVEDRRRAQASKREERETARLAVIAGGRRREDDAKAEEHACPSCNLSAGAARQLEAELARDIEGGRDASPRARRRARRRRDADRWPR